MPAAQFLKEIFETTIIQNPPNDEVEGKFIVKDFIMRLTRDVVLKDAISDDCRNKVNRFCKKIDVAPEIKAVYSEDLNKALSSEALDTQSLLCLMLILFIFSDKFNNAKFLNSAVKLKDKMKEKKSNNNINIFDNYFEFYWPLVGSKI